MKVLLDGAYCGSGTIDEVAADLLFDNPDLDISRLSYDYGSLAEEAKSRVQHFAEKARIKAIGDSGASHREVLLTEGVLAALTIAHTDSQLFDTEIAPAISAAFEAEAERRERGESSNDLMISSAKKMLTSLMVHGMVEGRVKSLSDKIEATPVDELDELLAINQVEAEADLREILSR